MRQVPDNINRFKLILPFFIVLMLDVMSFGIVAPVLAPLVTHTSNAILGMHTTNTSRHIVYGIIQMLFSLCFMIGAPILGYISDRFGRKKTLYYCVIGSFLALIGYALSFYYQSLLFLLISRAIGGFTTSSQAIAQAAIADISSNLEKVKNIGIIAVAMTIGLVTGPLLGGVLSDPSISPWFNNLTPFYAGIILTVINAVILLTMLRETHLIEAHSTNKNLWKNFIFIITKNNIYFILLTFFAFELGWSLYFQSLALLFAQSFHLSNKFIGIFSSYVGLVLSLGLIFGVRLLVNRFRLFNIITPSFIIGIIALLCGFFFNGMLIQCLIAIPIALIVAFCYSILITMASNKTTDDKQGILMGTTDGILALAFAITGFLAGILAIHNAVLPQLIAALFLLIGFILFPLAKKQYIKYDLPL